MPKINNPLTGHGKMIIHYKGNNELLKWKPPIMKRIYMHRILEVQPDVYENLIIETELVDGSSVCFSLKSANIYFSLLVDNEKKWVTSEEDGACFYEANIDNEQVVFEGSLSFKKEITPEFISHEGYQIILFFKYSKDLKELLDKNSIDCIYHS